MGSIGSVVCCVRNDFELRRCLSVVILIFMITNCWLPGLQYSIAKSTADNPTGSKNAGAKTHKTTG